MSDNSDLQSSTGYLFKTYLKGVAMGAADVVPGVSGGTIAFITGIYERLLNGIKSINPKALNVLVKDGVGAAWKHIDGTFLLVLFAGIFSSLLTLAKVLKWSMSEYPEVLWSFFMGLIIASTIYILRQIRTWRIYEILFLIIGVSVAYTITIITPSQAPNTYFMVFLSGSIAICAMILPGISGSFILLLMGMYHNILTAVTDKNIVYLLIFMVGCLVGLLSFSHVLSWTFRNYKNITLAVLSGFMIGSLNKVWPWQNVVQTRLNSHGEEVPWIMENVLPSAYSGNVNMLLCIACIIVGFSLVLGFEMLAKDKA